MVGITINKNNTNGSLFMVDSEGVIIPPNMVGKFPTKPGQYSADYIMNIPPRLLRRIVKRRKVLRLLPWWEVLTWS